MNKNKAQNINKTPEQGNQVDVFVSKPYCASYIKKARCGMCLYLNGTDFCSIGHKVKYPLITNEHNCKDYHFLDRNEPIRHVRAKEGSLPECQTCAYFFKNSCDGIRWWPFKTEPKCEFFRDKKLVCKNAVPMHQYGNKLRNNYCKLPPHLRHDENNNWKCMCPSAHTIGGERFSCYKPAC